MPDFEFTRVVAKDVRSGVEFGIHPEVATTAYVSAEPGDEVEVAWTIRNNTPSTKYVFLEIRAAGKLLAVRPYWIEGGQSRSDSKSWKNYGPALPPYLVEMDLRSDETSYQKISFTLNWGWFVKTIPFHHNAIIEYSTGGLLATIPGYLIYKVDKTTVTLTVKLGWVKVGGVEYKGWGGAWLIDGAFNPNPVTLTVDHNITAQSLPGAFSPFLPLEDVNLDGKIDIKEIFSLALAYGAKAGDPRYDPNLDFDGDGKIDIRDIFSASTVFGKVNELPPRTETLYEARAAVSAVASQAMAGAAATAVGVILAETARKIMREVKK
jgi:hypothetical protein